jgi:formate-dependent nitrite reductase cytochrome c552 subunit
MFTPDDSGKLGTRAAAAVGGKRRLGPALRLMVLLLLVLAGCLWAGSSARQEVLVPVAAALSTNQFEVVINRPPGPRLVATGKTNFLGEPVMASCSSCHATTKPNINTSRAEDLDQFHQGLKYNHGNLTCLSCHNSGDYETLRLADSRSLDFSDSMTLCSQCHGSQRRDYDRGLHGGMTGHWDLTRGGRARNTCIDCHDPHSPAFPAVMPVLAPRDRISVPGKHHAENVHSPAPHHE